MTFENQTNPPSALDFFENAKSYILEPNLDSLKDHYLELHGEIFACLQKMEDISGGFISYLSLGNRGKNDLFMCEERKDLSGHEKMQFQKDFAGKNHEIDIQNYCKILDARIKTMFAGSVKHKDTIIYTRNFNFFKIFTDEDDFNAKTVQQCANFMAMYYVCKESILYEGRESEKLKAVSFSSRPFFISFTREQRVKIERRTAKMVTALDAYHRTIEYPDSVDL